MNMQNNPLPKELQHWTMRLFQFFAPTVFIFFIVISAGCKKETKDSWQLCSNCPVELIAGNYKGKADHVKRLDTLNYITTRNNEAYMIISATSTGIAVQCGVINLFGASFSGSYQNSYYITLPGFSSNLNCRVWRDGDKVKIVGTAKKLDGMGETSELLDFEVYKTLN
jgi:hypothetical protein